MCSVGAERNAPHSTRNNNLDNLYFICYLIITLCTAYKSTVQTEQTVMYSHGVGSQGDSGISYIFIHGTVVTITDSWVFFYTFLAKLP